MILARGIMFVIVFGLISNTYADLQVIDVGSLIKRVITGEGFVGKELDLSGVVLAGGASASGIINLGTRATYNSDFYVNFISIYESTVALREGEIAVIRVKVEESSARKINGKDIVIIDTVFRKCLNCNR